MCKTSRGRSYERSSTVFKNYRMTVVRIMLISNDYCTTVVRLWKHCVRLSTSTCDYSTTMPWVSKNYNSSRFIKTCMMLVQLSYDNSRSLVGGTFPSVVTVGVWGGSIFAFFPVFFLAALSSAMMDFFKVLITSPFSKSSFVICCSVYL